MVSLSPKGISCGLEPPFDELRASGWFLSVHAEPDEARQAHCERKIQANIREGT